jgi:hypothetical protein
MIPIFLVALFIVSILLSEADEVVAAADSPSIDSFSQVKVAILAG